MEWPKEKKQKTPFVIVWMHAWHNTNHFNCTSPTSIREKKHVEISQRSKQAHSSRARSSSIIFKWWIFDIFVWIIENATATSLSSLCSCFSSNCLNRKLQVTVLLFGILRDRQTNRRIEEKKTIKKCRAETGIYILYVYTQTHTHISFIHSMLFELFTVLQQ